jgi:transposase InsO family protein
VSRSTYYYKPVPVDLELRKQLLSRIERILLEFPRYGYRRVTRQLHRDRVLVNHKVVLKIMRENGLLCKRKRSFVVHTTDSNHPYPIYPNLAKERVVSRLNQLWVSDITYIRILLGFVYLAVILDAFSRKVVGWALSRRLDRSLTIGALNMAIEQRKPPAGCIHHSDRGIQYAAQEYVDILKAHEFKISMSEKGNPYDNAMAESFMKTLKYDEVYLSEYRTFQDVLENVPAFIEDVYNAKRLHSSIGYLPPNEFESRWLEGNSPMQDQAA